MANVAGKGFTQAELNRVAGALAHDVENLLVRIADFKAVLDGLSAADLVLLPAGGAPAGFDASDAANLKSAMADLAELSAIASGSIPLAAAKDFRVFVRRIRGFSSVS